MLGQQLEYSGDGVHRPRLGMSAEELLLNSLDQLVEDVTGRLCPVEIGERHEGSGVAGLIKGPDVAAVGLAYDIGVTRLRGR